MPFAQLISGTPSVPSRWLIAVGCVLAAAGIAVLDYRFGLEISLIGLYVAPVCLAAWYGFRGAGYVTTLATSAGIILVDRIGGTLYSSHLIAYWDSLVNGVTLATLAALTGMVRTQLNRERRVSRLDPLTGSLNRQAFLDEVSVEA
ncbi:MAG: hypothetical protein ABEJ96_04260, partial [Thiohalorhabdaceae bacterium]